MGPGSCQVTRGGGGGRDGWPAQQGYPGRARRAGGAPVEALVVVVLRHMTVDVDPTQQGKDQSEGS